ncbi:hypothetical protein KC19_VG125600 [Ceratodon purpureus]|uniref:Myb-like domain-containing protein n=1 Tax=Ceratodon purpureus TaxID=3225 RepID=A0A8T0HQE9_CERPU|nr:hypothetical protein KC19_VG125600 [Ceratodon purpureus]
MAEDGAPLQGDSQQQHSTSSMGGQPRRAAAKKDRDPNWSKSEILSLIEAKRSEYIEELTVEDARELMCPELGKWGKIAVKINASKGEGDVERDGPTCKYKWNSLLSDFKKIWDFHARTGTNCKEYFTDTPPAEKKVLKLPKAFYITAYRNIAEFLRDKATLTPPHARDTMDPNNGNYQASIPDEGGSANEFLDRLGEDGWPGVQGPQLSPIDLTMSDSPQVSSA